MVAPAAVGAGMTGSFRRTVAMCPGGLSNRVGYRKAVIAVCVLLSFPIQSCAAAGDRSPDPGGFLYIASFEGLRGGFSTPVEVTYVDESGLIQMSSESADGELYELTEYAVDTKGFFDRLDERPPNLRATRTAKKDAGDMVHETLPPRTTIAFKSNAKPQLWSGPTASISSEVAVMKGEVERLIVSVRGCTPGSERGFLRAILLSKQTEREFRRAGLLRRLDTSTLDHETELSRALQHPYRLIRVQQANPFAPYAEEYRPMRSALDLLIDSRAIQVRSLSFDGSR